MAQSPIDASVIDPNDTRGLKNRYISELRDKRILKAVEDLGRERLVVDLGCGTGGLTRALSVKFSSVVGLDISEGLLSRTRERSYASNVCFAQYDGQSFPLRTASVDLIVTYGVLIYLFNDTELKCILEECHRVLMPGGRAIFVEQISPKPRLCSAEMKRQFGVAELTCHFHRAGLILDRCHVVRYGRFPLVLPIRFGLLPRAIFPFVSWLELVIGRFWGVPQFNYCDMLFKLTKPT
jgi:SAM-dependent methyltransferase